MKTLSKTQALQKISDSRGRMFSVVFKKRSDGSLRKMLCRTGVTKYLKGGKAPFSFSDKRLISVFDIQVMDYRCFGEDSIIELKTNGITYKVQQENNRKMR